MDLKKYMDSLPKGTMMDPKLVQVKCVMCDMNHMMCDMIVAGLSMSVAFYRHCALLLFLHAEL